MKKESSSAQPYTTVQCPPPTQAYVLQEPFKKELKCLQQQEIINH